MKQISAIAVVTGMLAFTSSHAANTAAGLATRDLNPVLQPIYIPAYTPFGSGNGWRIDHSLYVTNTSQLESKGDEYLALDVENYRYELGLRYRKDNWLGQVNAPFIANRGGEFDDAIDSWHDAFGLPEGDRNKFPKNDIDIEYIRDGEVEYSQDKSSSGLADISLALGYQLTEGTRYFVGIELPTGSESDYSGNEAIDFATWLTHETLINAEMSLYGLLGVSFPGDDGNLQGLLVDEIWVAQLGTQYLFNDGLAGTVQLDWHSEVIDGSDLTAFGDSLQIQLGLGFLKLFDNHRLDLFFSEDIKVESAPDITFGLRLAREF
ncbi:MAG: DUF3187 family protein [Gammaproteobacteria bacterium]